MLDWRFWRAKLHGKDLQKDLDDEIAHDLAAEAAEREHSGTPPEEAEWASRRDFGNILKTREDVRAVWIWTWLERLGQDLRYGWRTLRSAPFFTAMAVVSLGLGIGANTAIYSVMDAMMLRALPVRDAGQLVIPNWRAKSDVNHHSGSSYDDAGGGVTSPDFPWPFYEQLRQHNSVFSSLFAYQQATPVNLLARGQAEVGPVQLVSGNFFSGLGVVPAAGRLLAESDNSAGGSHVAVLSYGYWQSRFDGDPAVIEQVLRINNVPFTIAGVAAPGFSGIQPGVAPLVYLPIANRPALVRTWGVTGSQTFTDPGYYWVDMMGRLRPGVSLARAQAELAAKFHQFALASTPNKKHEEVPRLWLEPGGSGVDALQHTYATPLFVLMTMVACILAIACANIANLLLARSNARRREFAVRLSLGAGRLRVLQQLLTESLLLALLGAALGIGIAAAGIRFLLWLIAGTDANFTLRAGLDWRVLAFTIAMAFATGLLFGLAPALAATRVDVTPALKESRASAPHRRRRGIELKQLLVIAQIALSLLLVFGAAIFVRTLANLHSVALGFNPQHLLTFDLDASQAGYKGAALNAFYAQMDERFRGLPGVRAATLSNMPLVANSVNGTAVELPTATKQQAHDNPTFYAAVGPDFFETMQIPILQGRPINARDADGAPLAAVVNEVFAKKYFPHENPIGRQFGLNNLKTARMTIVGVAKDARYSDLKRALPPVTYTSYLQKATLDPPGGMVYELRTAGDPRQLAQAVRTAVHAAAPTVPVTEMLTQEARIDSTITQERIFAELCTAFALLALVIACVGLYGTMAYAVSRRTNEIGIRMALGAERRRVVWMVLHEVLALGAIGLALGLVCAWCGKSLLQSFVFGIKSNDPLATLGAAAILIVALLLAGYIPAARAARIDPATALRHE